ncbi:MAG: ABC transporter ATP-binding protein [Candidatus Riflebacteria bacterium]|nr:ABC transporter ATP-binding protein [Candidatus Riflebacteria bacterium]
MGHLTVGRAPGAAGTSERPAPVSSEPPVRVEHLCKEFGPVKALSDISFEAAGGEILGLLGPNGAGKTTLLHILLGLTTPTSGSAQIMGLDLATQREEILTRVNFSSAYTALPHNLTVRENLTVFAYLYEAREPRRKVQQLLEAFEIADLADRLTGRLSSGQLTRVNLCKSLINDPLVLLLDEPTASLDPDVADKVRRLLTKIRADRGLTVLYTSHNMREVEEVCDRVLFIHRGKVHAEGTPGALLDRFQSDCLEDVFLALTRDGSLYEDGSR